MNVRHRLAPRSIRGAVPAVCFLGLAFAAGCGGAEESKPLVWIRDGVGDRMVSVSSRGFEIDDLGMRLADLSFTIGTAVPAQSFALLLVRDGEVVVGHEDVLKAGQSKFGPYVVPGPAPARMQDLRAIVTIEIEGRDPLRIERTMSDADRIAK